MTDHPVEYLIAFAEGRLERSQRRAVVAHLLHGCPACGEAIEQALRKGRNLSALAYDAAFAGALLPVGGQSPAAASPAIARQAVPDRAMSRRPRRRRQVAPRESAPPALA